MPQTVDVQAVTIGVGTLAVVGILAYGTLLGRTVGGLEPTTAATGVFAGTFAVLGLVHAARGRPDFAVAYGIAAVGLGLVLAGSLVLGFIALVAGGGYVAVKTIRARPDVAAE